MQKLKPQAYAVLGLILAIAAVLPTTRADTVPAAAVKQSNLSLPSYLWQVKLPASH